MSLFLADICLLVFSGFLSLIFKSKPTLRGITAIGGVTLANLLGSIAALQVLHSQKSLTFSTQWRIPYGSFDLKIDALSAFFLLILFSISTICSLCSYSHFKKPASYFFFNGLIASIAITLSAQNAVLFLFSWEMMALFSFFLVMENHEQDSVRNAGLIYLISTHVGTAFLLTFFILIGIKSGSFNFNDWGTIHLMGHQANFLFFLMLTGFGFKAGFFPFHFWLPEADAAAPSPAAALMSGVLIKMGIFGLLKFIPLLGPFQEAWSWVLISLGMVSGIGGLLFALTEKDLYKILAFSSIENIGIILLALGIGFLGQAIHSPFLSFLGFSGAILHILNHAIFKSLLFLCAGSVFQLSNTRNIEQMGGLSKKAPLLSLCFLVGAMAITALPPLNGFISEFLIYFGAYQGSVSYSKVSFFPFFFVLFGLSLMSGLCLICFTRIFGMVFLGTSRNKNSTHAQPPTLLALSLLLSLSLSCLALGFASPWIIKGIQQIFVLPLPSFAETEKLFFSLQRVSLLSATFLTLFGFFILLRNFFYKRKFIQQSVTWDCGYVSPTPRMQYTASSFAQPITEWASVFLKTDKTKPQLRENFPVHANFAAETPEFILNRIYLPLIKGIEFILGYFRRLQHGKIQYYLLYILLTLIALLFWNLGFNP